MPSVNTEVGGEKMHNLVLKVEQASHLKLQLELR